MDSKVWGKADDAYTIFAKEAWPYRAGSYRDASRPDEALRHSPDEAKLGSHESQHSWILETHGNVPREG